VIQLQMKGQKVKFRLYDVEWYSCLFVVILLVFTSMTGALWAGMHNIFMTQIITFKARCIRVTYWKLIIETSHSYFDSVCLPLYINIL